VKNPITILAAIAMASCAPPKAIIVEEAPVKPVKSALADAPKPPVPTDPNDGMRLPSNMLALPDDSQLKPSGAPAGDAAAPVIVRPPKE
jgi:hypothetical protein